MDIKEWNHNLQNLRNLILKSDSFEEAKTLSLSLHEMVYASEMSNSRQKTFEDILLEGLTEDMLRNATNKKGRTILYGLWHSTRIEDITMNLLVDGKDQIFEKGNWYDRLNVSIRHTGNSLNSDEVIRLSRNINIGELRKYRLAVGYNSQNIIRNLKLGDFKRKVYQSNLQRIIDEKAVDDVASANWLIDFWGRKNVAGIILMPCLRHQLVHINESQEAKKYLKSK